MPDTTYTCNVCGSEYDYEGDLAEHMTTEHATQTETYEEGEDKGDTTTGIFG